MLGEKYISVKGIENAMEVAKVLVKNDYQVMVQLDDCDIYVVAYTTNESWGDNQFALVNYDELDLLEGCREQGEVRYLMSKYEYEVRDYLEEKDEDEEEDDDDVEFWDDDDEAWDSYEDDDEDDWEDEDEDEDWDDDDVLCLNDDDEDLDDDDWDELTDELGDEGKNF